MYSLHPRFCSSLLLLGLVACQDQGPDGYAQYREAVQPLLAKNTVLLKNFEQITIGLKSKSEPKPDAASIGEKLDQVAIPEAKSLAEAATAIALTEPTLVPVHQDLVDAWSHRATAWNDLRSAHTAGDLAAFDAAMELDARSRLLEDRWYDAAEAALRGHGQPLVRYPEAAAN
ncbi:MAG: hypothetical protein JNM72_04740 [Deltaproteobacteria bacterium]|nr:hypothetical protein [Deltaproteobacteria bacterium]